MASIERARIYSAADLWDISHDPAYAGRRFELSEGELIEMAPAGGEHGDLGSELNMMVRLFVREHNLGRVTTAETGFILHTDPETGRDTVRAPDVGFISFARHPDKLPTGYIPAAPDLAIEIISPNDRADEIERKVAEYLRYGVRLVWLFYPATKSVMEHTPNGSRRYDSDDVLDGGDVLSGFRLPLNDVFNLP